MVVILTNHVRDLMISLILATAPANSLNLKSAIMAAHHSARSRGSVLDDGPIPAVGETNTHPTTAASDSPLQLRFPYDRLDGDVILRCSDNVGFKVHRLILLLASPVFADMFSLPQSANTGSDTVASPPTIDLTENSKIIHALLDACYPFGDPVLDDLDTVDRLLDAAAKYDVDKATQFGQRRLCAFVNAQPLSAFAIACRMHFEDVANEAANRAHALSIFENGLVYVKELDRVSAGCYHRLIQHYRRRGDWEHIQFSRSTCGFAGYGKKPNRARDAPIPFHSESQTYAEITTSDKVRFGVTQEFISLAAPGIAERLTPSVDRVAADVTNISLHEKIDCGPVQSRALFSTTIEEDSKLLLPLLQLSHPDAVPNLPWDDLAAIRSMVYAARKYNMKKAIWFIQTEWQRSISLAPFRAYVLASSWGRTAQEEAAVAVLMRDTSEQLEARYTADMEELLAGPYFRLLTHHTQRTIAINLSDTWVLPPDVMKAIKCSYCSRYSGNGTPKWLRAVCTRARALVASRPSPDTVREGPAFAELVHVIYQEAQPCSECPSAYHSQSVLVEALASVVRDIVSKVIQQSPDVHTLLTIHE